MPHAEHFLSRIARLDGPRSDFALSLYRDPQIVRDVLRAAGVPEGVQRVALALDFSDDPPYLVVERSGAFVTCLGRGMRPHDTHTVSWPVLESLLTRVAELRSRMEQYRAAGGLNAVVGPIFERGGAVTREQISAAIAVAPLCEAVFTSGLSDVSKALRLRRENIVAHKGGEAFARSDEGQELLHGFWQDSWGLAHFCVVSAADHVERPQRSETARLVRAITGILFHTTNSLPVMLRGLWATVQFGPLTADAIEESWRQAATVPEIIFGSLALATLGRAHPEYLFSAGRALERLPDVRGRGAAFATAMKEVAPPWRRYARRALREPDLVDRHFGEIAEQALPARHSALASAARTAFATVENDLLENAVVTAGLLNVSPWLGRAKAEDLYLDRAQHELLGTQWNEEAGVDLYRRLKRSDTPRQPLVREAPKVGRNEPCACGSGRKSKRCCAA